ncbi:inosine/guanosine kinase, partial [Enterobacter intestinihominis]
NAYNKTYVRNSSKHTFNCLTYSWVAQVCKYANPLCYLVLNQNSRRLRRGLPEL